MIMERSMAGMRIGSSKSPCVSRKQQPQKKPVRVSRSDFGSWPVGVN